MKLNPYLIFNGNCREAMEFYAKCIGGELEAMITFGDMPADDNPDHQEGCGGDADMAQFSHFIAHACLVKGDVMLMASDCPPQMFEAAAGTSCSLHPDTRDEAERLFAAMSEGGTVTMPFGPTSWAEAFGMFKDKFGIPWMINFEGDKADAFA